MWPVQKRHESPTAMHRLRHRAAASCSSSDMSRKTRGTRRCAARLRRMARPKRHKPRDASTKVPPTTTLGGYWVRIMIKTRKGGNTKQKNDSQESKNNRLSAYSGAPTAAPITTTGAPRSTQPTRLAHIVASLQQYCSSRGRGKSDAECPRRPFLV